VRLDDFEDEEVAFLDERVVVEPDSKQAWHSAISGAPKRSAFSAVRPKCANLSISAPVVLPMPTTTSVSFVVGRLMTHSPLRRIILWLWFALEITQPTRDGVNSMTVRQPIVRIETSTETSDAALGRERRRPNCGLITGHRAQTSQASLGDRRRPDERRLNDMVQRRRQFGHHAARRHVLNRRDFDNGMVVSSGADFVAEPRSKPAEVQL
jgi:hypothetical protein